MEPKMPYSPDLGDVLQLSKAEAGRLRHNYIGAEHYLLAIIRSGKGLAFKILTDLAADIPGLKLQLEQELAENPHVITQPFVANEDARGVLEVMKSIAEDLRHARCGTEHLLLGLLKQERTIASRCLSQFQVKYEPVKAAVIANTGPLNNP